jgi:hypothetical protein
MYLQRSSFCPLYGDTAAGACRCNEAQSSSKYPLKHADAPNLDGKEPSAELDDLVDKELQSSRLAL